MQQIIRSVKKILNLIIDDLKIDDKLFNIIILIIYFKNLDSILWN